jgi:hypothetical protein
MHMPPPSPEETARAIELGHEPSTVSVKGLAWFFIWFFIFAVFIHVAIWLMYRAMQQYEMNQNIQRSALTTVRMHPPEPRLQPTREWHEQTEPEDLALMRGRNNLQFVRRGWINDLGEFRIPDEVINQVATTQPSSTK